MKLTGKTTIVIFLLIFLIIFLLLLILVNNRRGITPVSQETPVFQRTPPTPTDLIPRNEDEEKIVQENYAREREKFLSEKPWISKLPLRGYDYFISYDPQENSFLATIYYSNRIPKEQQVNQTKERVGQTIKGLGVDVNQIKIIYTEKEV